MTVQEFTTMLLAHMGCDGYEVEIVEEEEQVRVTLKVPEEESGMLIGRRGDTLTSVQRVISLAMRESLSGKRVVLEVNDYRQRREDVVKRIADDAVNQVKDSNQPYTLPYLSGDERRLVHTLLKDAGVETKSDGEGDQRRLTVFPAGYLQDMGSADVQSDVQENG